MPYSGYRGIGVSGYRGFTASVRRRARLRNFGNLRLADLAKLRNACPVSALATFTMFGLCGTTVYLVANAQE